MRVFNNGYVEDRTRPGNFTASMGSYGPAHLSSKHRSYPITVQSNVLVSRMLIVPAARFARTTNVPAPTFRLAFGAANPTVNPPSPGLASLTVTIILLFAVIAALIVTVPEDRVSVPEDILCGNSPSCEEIGETNASTYALAAHDMLLSP